MSCLVQVKDDYFLLRSCGLLSSRSFPVGAFYRTPLASQPTRQGDRSSRAVVSVGFSRSVTLDETFLHKDTCIGTFDAVADLALFPLQGTTADARRGSWKRFALQERRLWSSYFAVG